MTEGIEPPNEEKVRTLREKVTYNYLGILEADTIKQAEMKEKIKKEYLKRKRKLLETKLYSRNLIKDVLLERYSRPFLKWTKKELQQMDQRRRKFITMHKVLHPKVNVTDCVKKRKRNRMRR